MKRSLLALLIGCGLALSGPASAQTKQPEEPPTGPGVPASRTGGPDAYGYTFADQDDGCVYSFVDITMSGSQEFPPDTDDGSSDVALSAPMTIYGTDYNTIRMSSNGYLTTTSGSGTDFTNSCPIPGGDTDIRLLAMHDDLESAGYSEYFASCPRENRVAGEDCTVFQWDDVYHFNVLMPTWDMNAILYHQSGDIVYQIGPGNPEQGSGSTTGIHLDDGSTALTYACDSAASIVDNTAVCISAPSADLEIIKMADPPTGAPVGGQLAYAIVVTNNGPNTATGVIVTDTLPAHLSYVSDDCGAGAPMGQVWSWNAGSIALGASASCALVTEVIAVGTDPNVATVTGDLFDPDQTNNEARDGTPVPSLPWVGLALLLAVLGTLGWLQLRPGA